jgi:hypothetical protein
MPVFRGAATTPRTVNGRTAVELVSWISRMSTSNRTVSVRNGRQIASNAGAGQALTVMLAAAARSNLAAVLDTDFHLCNPARHPHDAPVLRSIRRPSPLSARGRGLPASRRAWCSQPKRRAVPRSRLDRTTARPHPTADRAPAHDSNQHVNAHRGLHRGWYRPVMASRKRSRRGRCQRRQWRSVDDAAMRGRASLTRGRRRQLGGKVLPVPF